MSNPDNDRVTSLTTSKTAYQAITPVDGQQRVDIATKVAFADDAIRLHSGTPAKAFDIGGAGHPQRK